MSRNYMTIVINIMGLIVVQVIEAWRPGLVSAIVPLPLLWLGCVIFLALASRMDR